MIEKKRAITVLAEGVVGIAVVAVAILYAAYGPFAWMPQRKWVTLAIITSAAFGIPVWWYKKSWVRPAFWLWLAVLLGIHMTGYSIALAHRREFPPLLAATSIPLEWLVIFPILRRTMRGDADAPPMDGSK